MKEEQKQHCPICSKEVAYNKRYPTRICGKCETIIKDINGELLVFSTALSHSNNLVTITSGCQGYYKRNKEEYSGNICYVNGIKCVAQEARFGGVVIQKE